MKNFVLSIGKGLINFTAWFVFLLIVALLFCTTFLLIDQIELQIVVWIVLLIILLLMVNIFFLIYLFIDINDNIKYIKENLNK